MIRMGGWFSVPTAFNIYNISFSRHICFCELVLCSHLYVTSGRKKTDTSGPECSRLSLWWSHFLTECKNYKNYKGEILHKIWLKKSEVWQCWLPSISLPVKREKSRLISKIYLYWGAPGAQLEERVPRVQRLRPYCSDLEFKSDLWLFAAWLPLSLSLSLSLSQPCFLSRSTCHV